MNITDNGAFLVKYTRDISMICEFYAKLGYEPTDATNDLATVNLGGHEIHFVRSDSEPFEQYKYIVSRSDTGNNDTILYVESTDLEADYKKAVEAGARIRCEVIQNLWGAKEFLLQDPSGLKISVYQI